MHDNNKTYSICNVLRAGTSRRKSRTAGFTIVELLIVIVVIGILAAITIVAYSGIQQKARDTARKSDVAAIAKLLKLYEVDHGPMYTGSGCGMYGDGSGWFNVQDGNRYLKSVMTCLKDAGLTTSTIVDPSGSVACSGLMCRAYMKYTCIQNGSVVTYVYANLEGLPHTASDTDGTCSGVSTPRTV